MLLGETFGDAYTENRWVVAAFQLQCDLPDLPFALFTGELPRRVLQVGGLFA